MPFTMLDRNGPPEAMHCPAVICDVCGEPIYAGTVKDAKGAGVTMMAAP